MKIKKLPLLIVFTLLPILIYFIFENFSYEIFIEIKKFINSLGNYAPIGYFLFFIISSLLFFPTQFLIIFSAIFFDFTKGLIISILGINIASIIAFYITRNFNTKIKLNSSFSKIFNKYISKIKEMIKKDLIISLIFLKFIIPTIAFSYAAGLIKELDFKRFFIATIIQNTFIAVVFLIVGITITKNPIFLSIGLIIYIIHIIIKKYFVIKNN